MTEYWQPWTPAVGDRVRVRLSPECWCWDRTSPATGARAAQDGRAGTIRGFNGPTDWDARDDCHTVVVDLDPARDAHGITAIYVAASELAPLAAREGG